jgi:molecular chaperone HscB
MHDTESCWKCGEPSAQSLFCRFCNTLQAPSPDYYRFLGLERRLSLDPADLQRRFYSLSRLVHPDRYLRSTPNEQRFALEATALLNDAYRTLRDPVARAEYVLKEEGFDVGEQKSNNVPAEMLEEVFELNEALEELRGGDASVRPQLEAARRRFRSLREEVDGDLETQFREYDENRQREVLGNIRAVLNRRRYIENLLGGVERELMD